MKSKKLKRNKENLVSIIILTMNQLKYTKMCINSIKRYTKYPYELIVVDNGSTDDTPSYLGKLDAKVIYNKENKGFAGGCNQGIRIARGAYMLLLNNDTIVTDGWLKRLVRIAESSKRIGLVGPYTNMILGDQRIMVNYSPIEKGEKIHQFAKKLSKRNNGKYKVADVSGFCLLIKEEVIEKIGLLDERFGTAYLEDVDFNYRTKNVGFKSVIAEDCFVHHFGSRTSMRQPLKTLKCSVVNSLKFVVKHKTHPMIDQWKRL